jgi:hypothetical protein
MEKLFSIYLWPWARILAEALPAGAVAQAAHQAHPASQCASDLVRADTTQ